MIIDDPKSYWIWIKRGRAKGRLPKNWLAHGGKWLIFDTRERLDELASKLDAYVEEGAIRAAKYNRKPGLRDTPVMCVYCLDTEKEKVWAILESLGVRRPIWKYDKQTLKDWEPGGRLYEESIRKTIGEFNN